MENTKSPVVLVVLDGWGWRTEMAHNPIAEANTPYFDELLGTYPYALLEASGVQVGLPEGQMGNSEIGHMVIGSGMPIPTDLVRLSEAMRQGEFLSNQVMRNLFSHVKAHGSALHLVSLLGPGGVHAHQDFLVGMLRAARDFGLTRIYIHGFTDGRDTPPQSAAEFVADLEKEIAVLGVGRIATLCGRFYAMDRDKNLDRTALAEGAIFDIQGTPASSSPSQALSNLYTHGMKDELLEPLVFPDAVPVSDHDAILFLNFRADRAVQLSCRIQERTIGRHIMFATMTRYSDRLVCPVAFPSFEPPVTLAEEIARAGLAQAHIAETEKYAHATYFLNGGREQPHVGEEFVLVDSRKDIRTHDQAPEMRAAAITDEALKRLDDGVDFMFINYANADMVGHTANHPAILRAIETLDAELSRLCPAVLSRGGVVCLTADHGNAEVDRDALKSQPHTAHTTNPVPFILTREGVALRKSGSLADIAPTILKLLDLPIPDAMQGTPMY